jgi:amidase
MAKTHHLEPRIFHYAYGPAEPALVVKPGDTVVTKTRDASGLDEKLRPLPASLKATSPGAPYYEGNPLVGPIAVEGARPGDALAVRIRSIALDRPTAWSSFIPHFGGFTGEGLGRRLLLHSPLPAQRFEWRIDRKRNVGVLALKKSTVKEVRVPLHPFIGSIGVAPRYGRVEAAMAPGEYGGNMDCVETQAGTTLYLPVWMEGGLLYFGDIHAAQGDGEVCGVALESSAEWPGLEDRSHIMVAASTRPLEDAFAMAHVEMVRWLVADFGYDKWEAYQVLSQVGTARVGNIVDPNYTVVAKFPKKYLPRVK